MLRRENIIYRLISAVVFTALTILMPTSCDIYDDLPSCPHGVNLRLVFDYNMEFANAFPSKVDCYVLYIYDDQGNFVKSYSEEGDKLCDEDYRLKVDLPHGKYHFVVYGGMTCSDASFSPVSVPAQGTKLSELQVKLHHQNLISDQPLHDLFHGDMDITVEGDLYRDHTIHLMRNTNNIRVLLQQLDGAAVPMNEFSLCITDDNSLLDAANTPIPNGLLTYLPWKAGVTDAKKRSESDDVNVGFAEFSTSRLCVQNENRLIVRRKADNREILSIPLNKYLLLLKSERYEKMGSQEFLDRESDWSLIFFLDSGCRWINTHFVVNNWVVRLDNVDF